jgi:hypothetical protein
MRTHFMLIVAAALAALTASPAAAQQPCNPVIDGTYCAENMSRSPGNNSRRVNDLSASAVRSIGSDLAVGFSDTPASLGTITFRGTGERCAGLLFRSSCK